jgi:hypothetical protein
MKPAPGLLRQILCRIIYHPDERLEPVAIDQPITDGETLPIAGGIDVVHVPGHCAGQVALIWRPGRMPFAADVFMNVTGLGDPLGFEDIERAGRASAGSPSFHAPPLGSAMASRLPATRRHVYGSGPVLEAGHDDYAFLGVGVVRHPFRGWLIASMIVASPRHASRHATVGRR